jgi:CTP synthase
VIENATISSLYEVPLMLHRNGLDKVACRELGLDVPEPDLSDWQSMTQKITARKKTVRIALVGKYTQLHDAYLSIIESLNHAGFETATGINIRWIESEDLNEGNVGGILGGIDGIIIPGGFGDRGIEGKVIACQYARENDIPFLGICLGMQITVIEFARNICALPNAHSSEFDEDAPHCVINLMPDQVGIVGSGGTMRLGTYPCKITQGTLLHRLYGTEEISERHRHRFEFNNDYREILTSKGLVLCGTSPDGNLIEAVELPNHRFFVGVQFHPEFRSRPNRPHPLFVGLLRAATDEAEDVKSVV